MNWSVLIALMLGYSVGSLPDHGTLWVSVKLAMTAIMLVLAIRLARREGRSA